MTDLALSIIVPVYNIEDYLPRCIESILNQTHQNLQLILVDDGSKDGSGAICDAYAQKDDRVLALHKENGGSSSARNLGIEHAAGEYLGFVDSDDYIEPDMYEKMVTAIGETGCSIVQVARDEKDEQGNKLPDICEMPETMITYSGEEFLKELLLHKGDCSFCTKLIKKDVFAGMCFPQGVLNEDFHLLVKMLKPDSQVVSLPYCGYHVFYRIGSNTRKKDKNDFSRVFADSVDNADMVYGIVKKDFPNLEKVAVRFGLFQRMEYLLHIPIAQMTGDNAQYRQVCGGIRQNFWSIPGNKYLTLKNKIYLLMFAIAPKGIRVVHAKLKGFS